MKSVAKKIARPKITFYAKRTQFPKRQNERNSLSNKQLRRKTQTPLHHPNEPKRTRFFSKLFQNFNLYPLPILTLAPMLEKQPLQPAKKAN